MGIFSFGQNWQARKGADAEIARLEAESGSAETKGRKKKIDRAVGDQREISRRAFMQLLGGGAAVVAGAAVSGAGVMKLMQEPEFDYTRKPSVHMTPIRPVVLTGQDNLNRMLELQEYWKRISLEALEGFRNADPKVAELIQFMSENAEYSIPMGPVVTQMIFKNQDPQEAMAKHNNPRRFEMVYMPEEYASGMPAPILTQPDGTMRLATNFRMKEWLGIMLAHELSHEYDLKMNAENPHNQGEYLAGEVKAHSFEMKLLKSWDPKIYDELIKRGTPLFEGVQRGASMDKLIQLINSLYPTTPEYASAHESSLGAASCLVAIAFEDARSKGKTDKDLESVYQDIFRKFGGGGSR
ncbi:MAG: hypothetical protein WC101_00705 [Candidatus Gracilibacteria bacterium]